MSEAFSDSFDTFIETFWTVSDFAIQANFIDTAWSADNVIPGSGSVDIELNTNDTLGKNFTGAEFKTTDDYFYGRYEVTMRPSGETGVLSTFFVFTGAPFGDPRSEIDFEFIGEDTTEVLVTYHTPEGSDGEIVQLGFDASLAEHTYAFEWGPDSISWYADGTLLRTVEDPEIGTPAFAGQIFASIWTGSNSFTGVPEFQTSTTATYSNISFVPRTAPIALNDKVMTDVDTAVMIDILGNDSAPNGALDASTVVIDGLPAVGTVSVDPITGAATYTPLPGYQGFDTFSYTVTDGTDVSNSGDVTVGVGIAVFETFTTGSDGFVYIDDAFRGTSEPNYADGEAADGVLRVTLGGVDKSTQPGMSGGWTTSFESVAGQSGSLSLRYRLEQAGVFEAAEVAELLVQVDGTEYVVAALAPTDNNDTEVLDTGFVDVVLDLGALSPGTHTLTVGGFLAGKSSADEIATIEIDSLSLALISPSPADDDG
ncbi:MAG: family 16 glycosylhydrolase, partial [Pseudomonadota bacterium]